MLELARKKEEQQKQREQEEQQNCTDDSTLTFPMVERPLYCHALSGQVICFEGYKKSKNEDIERLVRSIGSVRTWFHISLS